jgi:hypothetical protein
MAMPWKSTIDPHLRLVYTRVSGTLTMAGAVQHQKEVLSEPDFDPTFAQILDLRDVDEVRLSTNEMRTLASSKIFAPTSRRALVATQPSTFGLARIYGVYREDATGTDVAVVKSVGEAYEWVGITPDSETPIE